MRTGTLIAAGALAATALGAGVASAAPTINSVDANRVGHGRVKVAVHLARGTAATPPTVDVTVNGRTRHARALDWAAATQPTDAVTYAALFRGGRRAYTGSTVAVHVHACDADGTCTDFDNDVSVTRIKPKATSGHGSGAAALAPLPAGSVDASQAAAIALGAVGPGSTLIEVERADEMDAAWEVKVLRADGARVKVYVAADGTVVSTRVEGTKAGGGDDHHAPGTVPAGAVTPEQATASALAFAGPGSTLISIKVEVDDGAVYEVKVLKADGTRLEVKVAADGSVVKAEVDH